MNLKEKDIKARNRNNIIFKITGYLVTIVSAICLLLTILADDFSVEALCLLILGIVIIIFTKGGVNNERWKNNRISKRI